MSIDFFDTGLPETQSYYDSLTSAGKAEWGSLVAGVGCSIRGLGHNRSTIGFDPIKI